MIRTDAIAPSPSATLPVRISPAFRKLPAPIIVIGMHRSGTSMVAGMLSVLGVFIDPAFPFAQQADDLLPDARRRTDGYAESVAFRLLNESILARAGAHWFDVDPLFQHRDSLLFARSSVVRMQLATYSSLLRGHVALHPNPSAGLWGWKDPRTSLLLPYWLRLFPQARLIHVRRQDDGVVNSLIRRATQQANSIPLPPPPWSHRAVRMLRYPGQAMRAISRRLSPTAAPSVTAACLQDQDFCRRLTNRYVRECLHYRSLGDRYLELWYEDVLENPTDMAERIAQFAQLAPEEGALRAATNLVSKDRRPAQKVATTMSETLSR